MLITNRCYSMLSYISYNNTNIIINVMFLGKNSINLP